MQYYQMYVALSRFTEELQRHEVPVGCMHLRGSTSRSEADAMSDMDVVVVLDTTAPLEELRKTTHLIDLGVQAARQVLVQGGHQAKFSVPKIARIDDWEWKHWLQPAEYGVMDKHAPVVAGSNLCIRRPVPQGRVLYYDAVGAFAFRLCRFFLALSDQLLQGEPLVTLRFKVPSWVLRLAIWLDTGLYLRGSDAVFSTASRLYGGMCTLVADQMQNGIAEQSLVLSRPQAFEFAEQLIALYRRIILDPLEECPVPVSFPPISEKWSPLITESEAIRVRGSLTVLHSRLESKDSLLVVARSGQWAQSLSDLPKAVEPYRPFVAVIPEEVFRTYVRYHHSLAVCHSQADATAQELCRKLNVEPDAYTLKYRALRYVSYFRYNALNKWVDLGSGSIEPAAAGLIRALEILVVALRILQSHAPSFGKAEPKAIQLIQGIRGRRDAEWVRTNWLQLADLITPMDTYLTPSVRTDLDGFIAASPANLKNKPFSAALSGF